MSKLTQGDIWLANLNPNKKSEPGKIRPVLIIQNQYLLDAGHSTTIIIPLTTKLIDDTEPLRIRLTKDGKLDSDSDLLLDQIRAIDNTRLIEGPLASLDHKKLTHIIESLRQLIELV